MNMRKFFLGRAIGFFVLLAILGIAAAFYALNSYLYEAKQATAAADYKDGEYMIEGVRVKLKDGVSEVAAAPGSSSKIRTAYFGNELHTDLDGDGRDDVAFLLTQQSGGSGTFYYVVAALNTERGYVGSDGYLLGDRIAPQSTNVSQNPRHKNVIVVNYADRVPGEPMTAQPSVGKSAYLKLDPASMQWGIVEPDFEGESAVATGLECHDSSKYFLVQKSLSDSVGSDILIKYKTTPEQSLPCVYAVAKGDFEIKNVSAEYFLAFTDNFLILDSGTAPPPRGLVVYDLRSRNIVFTDSYTKPVVVAGDAITYWSKTDQKPTVQNCPDLPSYTANGLGAAIMSKVTVDLPGPAKKGTGAVECIATQ